MAIIAFAMAASAPRTDAELNRQNTQSTELLVLQAAFHQALSHNGDPALKAQHLELMDHLWAGDGVLTIGGNTFTGKDAVVAAFAAGAPFNNNWASLAPSFRTDINIHGDTGDIYFECYFINSANAVVVQRGLSGTVKKVQGEWVFSNIAIGPPASPLF